MRTIDYIDRGVDIDPDRTAIIDIEGGEKYSFREMQAITHKIAWAMKKSGHKHQEPAAIYSPNAAGVLLTLLGLWRMGAIWIPVNARNAIDANIQYMNYVHCAFLFYHSKYREDALNLKRHVPSIRTLVCLDKEDGDIPSLEKFIADAGDEPYPDWGDAFGNLEDVVGIFPTGGTTGPSKGVIVNHLGWNTMLGIATNAWGRDIQHPVCLVTAPLTHAAGPVSTAMLSVGATNVIMPGFEALGVLKNIDKYRVTNIYVPPTALYALLERPELHDYDYSSLRYMLLVGSPVSPDKMKRAVEVFGPCICQSYGQVESPMITTWLPPDVVAAAARGDHPERLASCGRPSYPVRVGIMDEEGHLLPPGERGEIVVRGPLVSKEYFDKPEATKEVRTFGWHHTGDVAYRDKDGFIYIVDRKKDMIVTGGYNVFSAEVEACVMEMDQVAECAVIGVPHDKWGEAVTAIIVPAANKGKLTAEDVIGYCKKRLGGVKAPKMVEFWPEIPKTPANKMDKKSIRAKFWSGSDRNVH
jgi:acyl-CoA synthetase (AMP-forming)/AMP-acid ligase II